MDKKLIMSASPHVGSSLTTKKIMQCVTLALMPATVASVIFFGLYPLLVVAVSVLSSIGAEYFYCKLSKKPLTIGDWSAVVTGLLIGLNMPPVLPLYIPVIGSVFAIIVVKMLFGGLGKNFANPAITARIFLVLSYTGFMTTYVAPVSYSNGIFNAMTSYFKGFGMNLDAYTSATPLGLLKDNVINGADNSVNLFNMFIGNIGGSLGEVSALALIIGGGFLIAKRIIDWKIPVTYLATVMLLTYLLYPNGADYVLPMVFGGGVMLAAFFMLTDYSSSPNTPIGVVIFSIGAGLITVLIRRFGGYPGGVSFAILFMNLTVPLLDKYLVPRRFGVKYDLKGKLNKIFKKEKSDEKV